MHLQLNQTWDHRLHESMLDQPQPDCRIDQRRFDMILHPLLVDAEIADALTADPVPANHLPADLLIADPFLAYHLPADSSLLHHLVPDLLVSDILLTDFYRQIFAAIPL